MDKEEYEESLNKLMEKVMAGPPPSFRVIAKFGDSNYDITITKLDEINMVEALLSRFRSTLHNQPNNLF